MGLLTPANARSSYDRHYAGSLRESGWQIPSVENVTPKNATYTRQFAARTIAR
jgi:hypothetical protein